MHRALGALLSHAGSCNPVTRLVLQHARDQPLHDVGCKLSANLNSSPYFQHWREARIWPITVSIPPTPPRTIMIPKRGSCWPLFTLQVANLHTPVESLLSGSQSPQPIPCSRCPVPSCTRRLHSTHRGTQGRILVSCTCMPCMCCCELEVAVQEFTGTSPAGAAFTRLRLAASCAPSPVSLACRLSGLGTRIPDSAWPTA